MGVGVRALLAARHLPGLEEDLPTAVQLSPTASFELASVEEQTDAMLALATRLMGFSMNVQLVCQAREVDYGLDWPRPARLERHWYAAVQDDKQIRTLTESLNAIGLRCGEPFEPVPPAVARVHKDAVLTEDGLWSATLLLKRWPRQVAAGWLGKALSYDVSADTAIHIQPQDPDAVHRFIQQQQSMLTSRSAGHQLAREDAERVGMNLVAKTDRPVKVAIAFTVLAPTKEELKQRIGYLTNEIGLTLGFATPVDFEHDRGRQATQPGGICSLLGAWQTLDCISVASTWLFQPATVLHERGAPLGTSHGMLVKLDPFDESLESFGGIVLAKVGAGKTYLLQLLARNLQDVEVFVVEQRNPPEFANVPGVKSILLTGNTQERIAQLRQFITDLWETAMRDPRPRLLILDELWSLLRQEGLAAMAEEVARIGRHHYLSAWIATQQVEELMNSEEGLATLNNAAIKVYLKQTGPDGAKLAKNMHLSAPARQYLRSAARGQALLDVAGMLIPVDIQTDACQHSEISTDPRERYGRPSSSSFAGAVGPNGHNGIGSARPVPVGSGVASGRLAG
jgi:hypothetical protein